MLKHVRESQRFPTLAARRLPAIALLTSVSLGCTDSLSAPAVSGPATSGPAVSAPAGLQLAGSSMANSTYDAATLTLGVTIGAGVSRFGSSGYYKVWRNVQGGTGPHTSYWYADRCFEWGCPGRILLTQTTADTIEYLVEPDLIKVVLYLIVGDASTDTWTGGSSRSFLGPISVSPTPTMGCTDGDDPSVGYPFHIGVPPDPINQTGYYRLNVCTGDEIYEQK